MAKATTAYIGIGSNLGNRRRYVESSVKMLAGAPELGFLRMSHVIETAPLSQDGQPNYLNAVAEVETELDSHINIDAAEAKGFQRDLKSDVEKLKGLLDNKKYKPSKANMD